MSLLFACLSCRVDVKADVKEFFCFLRPSAAFAASTVPLIYVRYVRNSQMHGKCIVKSKAGLLLGFLFHPGIACGIPHTPKKRSRADDTRALNDQLGIINGRYYRDYMSIYAKYEEADGHKTLNSEILQTI